MHVIAVTVGVSIIEKTWKSNRVYEQLMGSDDGLNEGLLSRCDIDAVAKGNGWPARGSVLAQREFEVASFQEMKKWDDIPKEIERGKRNHYSAEVSSLYAILKDREEPSKYRIVLLATDSQEGVFAARLNKRIIAHKLFNCDEELVLQWNGESDNGLHPAFSAIPIRRVSGLQVKDAALFENEGNESLQQIIKELDSDCGPGDEKILNMTGGFKGVIPIAVGIGWYYGWKVAYLYEETKDCLSIERPSFIKVGPPKDKHIVPLQRAGLWPLSSGSGG